MFDSWQSFLILLRNPTVNKIIEVVIGIIIIYIVVRLLKVTTNRAIQQSERRYYVRKVITFGGYGAMLVFTASVFSTSLGQLAVVFGVVGAGITFALQEVIGSIAGWMAISLGHYYAPGDRVQVGGIRGDVIDISLLRTTVMECGSWVKGDLYNGRIVRIANSFVFKEPVFNYSADFPFLWDEIKIPIKYGGDRTFAEQLLQTAAEEIVGEYSRYASQEWDTMVKKYLIEAARVQPAVTLIANDNWMEYTVRYVVDYKERRIKKHELFNRILDGIENSGKRIELASATYHLVETPTIDVRLKQGD